ncbi:MAG: hypothetical protein G01um101420_379 [Parcubacteria group bacterium Gr01-1014_20]|nr:MAG: hypothetical protein G01um101420_379 [Parcubacteria group bacterium Gr01-1014_20]
MPKSFESRFLIGFLISLVAFAAPVLWGASKLDAAPWDRASTEATMAFIGLYIAGWIALFAALFTGVWCASKAK